jgi:hypothetical protein
MFDSLTAELYNKKMYQYVSIWTESLSYCSFIPSFAPVYIVQYIDIRMSGQLGPPSIQCPIPHCSTLRRPTLVHHEVHV